MAEKAKFVPAIKVMEKEGLNFDNEITESSCYLCDNIFSDLAKYTLEAIRKLENLDYESILEGTNLNLAVTYFRIGLLHEKNGDELLKDKYFSQAIVLVPNSEEILTNDFRSLVNKLDKNFSE